MIANNHRTGSTFAMAKRPTTKRELLEEIEILSHDVDDLDGIKAPADKLDAAKLRTEIARLNVVMEITKRLASSRNKDTIDLALMTVVLAGAMAELLKAKYGKN